MKFIAFHLMPYQSLPDDFEQKYDSVWVTVPKQLFDPAEGHRMYHEYLDELELAADLGFDAVGVNEHHSNAYGLMPSPNLMASILARSLRRRPRTNLMVLGNSLALYNPPVRVAEEFAMLDVLSGGRLIAGFPVGTSMDVNYAYGINPAELRERYYEAHDLVMRAWRSDDVFEYNGKYNKLRYVNPWPRPAQHPHPPVWIPGGGSVETYRFSIEHGYSFSYLSYHGIKYARKVMYPFWQTNDELGADRNPYKAGFCQIICVSETDERAQQEYERHVRYFFDKCNHIHPRFAEAPGYRTPASLRAGLRSQFDGSMKSASQMYREGMGWNDLVRERFVVAGSPASVVEQLEEGIEDLRIGNLICLLHIGSMPKWLTIKNMTLFATEVIPRLRHKFAEWDPSPYWPKGMPNAAETAQSV
ncbi:MAG: LLM class flavin-dependent oxidoreductase [Alicyclobacillaceae bacterium]|nr:LLM class flavin-dependent oxidoreductase [Alicyclobacillaceae bacterium]